MNTTKFTPRRWRRYAIWLSLCLPWGVVAQPSAPEAELKAAILVNMLLFVEWPEQGTQAAGQLTLCHLGTPPVPPVVEALLRLDGKMLKNRRLSVLQADAAHLPGCHMVYLAAHDATLLETVVSASHGRGIFLAGDTPGYLARGVMLNLELSGERVVFDVDLRAVRQAGLIFSSKALRLARRVMD